MFAIAYRSIAYHVPSQRELEVLLLESRTFNASIGVTGALLLSDVTFFQYFEGEEADVLTVYDRIRRSRMHRAIIEFLRGPVPQRYFARWHMGFADVPAGAILQISQAGWSRCVDEDSYVSPPPGVDLLLEFWARERFRR